MTRASNPENIAVLRHFVLAFYLSVHYNNGRLNMHSNKGGYHAGKTIGRDQD